ncbi:MAG: bifunctional DNA primase/polymerase, partial [bacterium]
KEDRKKSMLEYALDYQKKGWNVIPANKDKTPSIGWKLYQTQKVTVEEINNWWAIWPDANIAVITGKISGIVVLDIDSKHGRTSDEFPIPATVCSKTGNDGKHIFFKYPQGVEVKSGTAISGEGIDYRGDGGYAILAPSINSQGGQYEWLVPVESNEDLAEMPDWFKELVTETKDEKKWLKGKDGVTEGSRNDTATSMTGKILSNTDPKLWESLGWEQLKIWNQKNTKPLSEKELRGVWDSIKSRHQTDNTKDTQTNKLLEDIIEKEGIVLFHDEQGNGFASLEVSGHREIKGCGSTAFKVWISNELYKRKKNPNSELLKSILAVLEGKARYEGEEIELKNRATWSNSELWYDLTNKDWQAIKVNKTGWSIIDNPPILFRRYSHNKAQVIPEKEGDVKTFLKYINIINEEHRLLMLVFLVASFIPEFPHVLLVIFGAQGSSKSTLSKLARLVIDPSVIDVASFPNNTNDLIQTLAHHYFLFLDNVSHISEDQSDTLCKAITGGGHTKRKLYGDDDDVIYNFMRSIGINGINLVTTKPDLLERSLLLEVERIEPEQRKTEKELYASFEKDLPFILGGIFNVLVKSLEIHPTIKLESKHRMADWESWGCAISEALGYSQEEFLKAYQNNINRQSEMLVNENIVSTAVITLMKIEDEWKGTPTQLLYKLSALAMLDGHETEKYWPKGAGALSRKLNELSTTLKQMGISVVISTTGTERYIHIKNLSKVVEKKLIQGSLISKPAQTDDTDDVLGASDKPINPDDIPF